MGLVHTTPALAPFATSEIGPLEMNSTIAPIGGRKCISQRFHVCGGALFMAQVDDAKPPRKGAVYYDEALLGSLLVALWANTCSYLTIDWYSSY